MAKVYATVTFVYDLPEEYFPDGIAESDIREEERILDKLLKKTFKDEGVEVSDLDSSLKL